MDIILNRHNYSATETEGILHLPGRTLSTIERPWVKNTCPGGKPFESCIPDGTYNLSPWVRPSGDEVYILSNPDLGIFEEQKYEDGRYLILIHVGNWVTDVVGCIAPGTHRTLLHNARTGKLERAVSSSGEAMRIITGRLGREENHRLIIRPELGTQ